MSNERIERRSCRLVCKRGHYLLGDNAYYYRGWRLCRTCKNDKMADIRSKNGRKDYTPTETPTAQEIEEKFRKGLVKVGDCVVWKGKAKLRTRYYGLLVLGTVRFRTHRLSYELHHGPVPEGMFVCHTCDYPPCCNPDHLFLGTHQENNRDMVRKGRLRNGATGKLTIGAHF